MVPELPIATKVLFAKVTLLSSEVVPEVLDDHEFPSDDVSIVPD